MSDQSSGNNHRNNSNNGPRNSGSNQSRPNNQRFNRRGPPSSQSRNSNNNNQRPRNNPPRPINIRSLNSVQILQRYDQLLDQHLLNRKKYYELFYRADDYNRSKLEKNFYKSVEELRSFEAALEDWQREYLKKKTDRYQLDLTYSRNHDLDPKAIVEEPTEIEDPHFTPAQKEAYDLYKQDNEESMGSYEDYLKLKGIEPSTPKDN